VIIRKNFSHLIKRVYGRYSRIGKITKQFGKFVHIKVDNNVFESGDFDQGKINVFFEKNLGIVENRKNNSSSDCSP